MTWHIYVLQEWWNWAKSLLPAQRAPTQQGTQAGQASSSSAYRMASEGMFQWDLELFCIIIQKYKPGQEDCYSSVLTQDHHPVILLVCPHLHIDPSAGYALSLPWHWTIASLIWYSTTRPMGTWHSAWSSMTFTECSIHATVASRQAATLMTLKKQGLKNMHWSRAILSI